MQRQSFRVAAPLWLAVALALSTISLGLGEALESGFLQPPPCTKAWVYWYWISDNLSRDGLTRDLEAMARVEERVAG